MLCSFIAINSQNVKYFKLIKKQHNGVISSNVSGGQFLTFLDNICYESNKKGIGLGHGTLTLNKNYSNNDFIFYMGSSYWGNSTTFKFKHDFSMLNVITEDGDIYVFKHDSPPAGVTTSSYIHKNTSNSREEVFSTPDNASTPQKTHNMHSKGNSQNNELNQRQNTTKKRKACRSCMYTNGKCSVCKGRGLETISVSGHVSKVQCRNCGGSGRCPICGGDGWIN